MISLFLHAHEQVIAIRSVWRPGIDVRIGNDVQYGFLDFTWRDVGLGVGVAVRWGAGCRCWCGRGGWEVGVDVAVAGTAGRSWRRRGSEHAAARSIGQDQARLQV